MRASIAPTVVIIIAMVTMTSCEPLGKTRTLDELKELLEDDNKYYNCYDRNPCTPENAAAGRFYFSADNTNQFIQCSEWGQCYVKNCPQGLVWNQAITVCDWPSTRSTRAYETTKQEDSHHSDVTTTKNPTSVTSPSHIGTYNCDNRNPCTPENAAAGRFYFSADNTNQFIQCSEWGQCYVKNCPQGLVWNQAITVCDWPSTRSTRAYETTKQEDSHHSDVTTTKNPTSVTSPSHIGTYNCDNRNPCTPENAAAGRFYFSADNKNQFIQCSEWGQCYVMNCPQGLVWNPAITVCDWPSTRSTRAYETTKQEDSHHSDVTTTKNPTSVTSPSHIGTYNCDNRNPCTPENAAAGRFYFSADNTNQFIQCSEWGQCYVKNCPQGLVWNQAITVCDWPSTRSTRAYETTKQEDSHHSDVTTTKNPTSVTSPSHIGTYNCDNRNPCTPENAAAGRFYFSADNKNQFIQCSEWGQCYVMNCPQGLVWNPAITVCDWPSTRSTRAYETTKQEVDTTKNPTSPSNCDNRNRLIIQVSLCNAANGASSSDTCKTVLKVMFGIRLLWFVIGHKK